MDESIVPQSIVSQKAHVELPEVLQEPTSSKRPLFLVLYGVANMVIGIGNITLATVLLPMQIASMVSANQTGTFALIVGVGAVAAVLTNPLVGMLSDRTTSRFGRRRSWLVAGGILTVAAVLLLSVASSLLLVPGQTTAQGVQTFFAINVGSILVASLFGGMLSDKMQRRKLFVIVASIIMTVGLLLYAFFPTWAMVIVATVVLGLGMGVFLAVDLALASQVLPRAADRGKDMGIINTAIFLPMILSPLIAGITLGALHSYLPLFVLLAVGALIAAVLIVPIKSVR